MSSMSPPGPPILIIEDSDEDFDTFREAVQRARLANEVRRATTGGDGLDLMRGGGPLPFLPGLILLDLNTPGTDGRQALQAIKADPALRKLPVVVLTTSASPQDLAFCYETGANACHIKPVRYPDHLQVVLDVLAYWLERVALPDDERLAP